MPRLSTLPEDEKIILEKAIHWKNYLFPTALLCICSFSMIFRIYFRETSLLNRILGFRLMTEKYQLLLSDMEIVLIGAFAAWCILTIIRISAIRYYVTDRRVISISGILNRNSRKMLVSRIETVYLNQNLYERLFNCGDVLCVAPGSQIFLDDVSDAEGFRDAVLNLTNNKR